MVVSSDPNHLGKDADCISQLINVILNSLAMALAVTSYFFPPLFMGLANEFKFNLANYFGRSPDTFGF